MRNMSEVFSSRLRAEKFAQYLKTQNCEDIEISSWADPLNKGMDCWRVEWNLPEEN